jgi:hypothetical protein
MIREIYRAIMDDNLPNFGKKSTEIFEFISRRQRGVLNVPVPQVIKAL